jgi:hypothetical protein
LALYAAAASGFSPQAYVELFDRSAETNGNRGSVLNDFFGTTTSNLRRLREIKNALKQLPQPCREIVPAASAEFRTWQAAVMSDPDLAADESCKQDESTDAFSRLGSRQETSRHGNKEGVRMLSYSVNVRLVETVNW